MDQEVQVLPHLVVEVYVHFKAFFGFTIKSLSVDVANEANVLNVYVCLFLLVS